MNKFLNLFTPNKIISKSTVTILISVQVIILFILWVFSPIMFLPTLGETVKAFTQLWSEGIVVDLFTSFTLNIQAIFIATIVSLLFSYAGVLPFFNPIVKIISKLRFLSLVGLTFFFTLMANSGHALKLYLLVFTISVFFITSVADILNSIPKVQFDLARTLRMGEWRIVYEVIILGQIDKVFDALRQNSAVSWMMLTLVEGMSRSEGGIGALLLNANKHFHLSSVMAIQLMILAIGLGQDYFIGILKNILCPYASLTLEKK